MSLPPATYSAIEVAELLDMSKSSLYRNVKEGKAHDLRPIKVGNALRFPRKHIDQLLGLDSAA